MLNFIIANSKVRITIYFVLACLFMLLLSSYDSNDPTFNLAIDNHTGNFLGRWGANTSAVLLHSFGISSYFIPCCLLVWASLTYRRGGVGKIKLRLLSLVIAMITTSYILYSSNVSIEIKGVIGILIGNFTHFNRYDFLFYISALLISFTAILVALGYTTKDYIAYFYNMTKKLKQLKTKVMNYKLPQKLKYEPKNNFAVIHKPLSSYTDSKLTKTDNESSLSKIVISANQEKEISLRNQPRKSEFYPENFKGDRDFTLPLLNLLSESHNKKVIPETEAELLENAQNLLKVLKDFGIRGKILNIGQGPVVTLYEFEPEAGTKSARVIGLSDDIARSLSAMSTRIAVVPGKNVLGIELPNKQRMFFSLGELIDTAEYNRPDILLPIILGKDLAGKPEIVDLAKMPHLLVAGTTGSGKSVSINTMILSLLFRFKPDECKFIMIDPKMLELSVYDGIPHLLTPVVTEPGKAVVALKWAVKEMENRYRLMTTLGVRNIAGYNSKIADAIINNTVLEKTIQTGFNHETGKPIYESIPISLETLPFIVVIVDEMADLMIVAGKEIESLVQRLAQMARAAGIHIIMATQRPSVDVITGVIKANFPSRVSFKVTSKIDSRTILGDIGAEQLLGMGDMLYMGSSTGIKRVHGPFVDDNEVQAVVKFLKSQSVPTYVDSITLEDEDNEGLENQFGKSNDYGDDRYERAIQIIKRDKKVSISYIQRCLRIGYNAAANIVERMEKEGIVSAPGYNGKREILIETED